MTDNTPPPLGKLGEDAACRWLTERGYQIIARNWRCLVGEIDVVAQVGGLWVFVEVRARRSGLESTMESITPAKRRRMVAAAYAYVDTLTDSDPSWRIDVVGVAVRRDGTVKIEHVEDALDW
ncbi:MAG: YraN family protein [Anaerolineae bacterium]|nr:YraN family protein [Anaerolineae bacterium]